MTTGEGGILISPAELAALPTTGKA